MKTERFEYLEVPAQDEKYYTSQGWEKYGMRGDRDLRFSKMRRPLGKESKK
ncbi:MAG TPA: hypothetical protein VN950_01260 [Terriglobales bacterium]|nr:hypothetical protein [Terriglobales bacterium]